MQNTINKENIIAISVTYIYYCSTLRFGKSLSVKGSVKLGVVVRSSLRSFGAQKKDFFTRLLSR